MCPARSVESKDDSGTRELPSESNLEKSAAELVAAIRRRVRSLSDDGRARLRKRLSAVDPSSPMQRCVRVVVPPPGALTPVPRGSPGALCRRPVQCLPLVRRAVVRCGRVAVRD